MPWMLTAEAGRGDAGSGGSGEEGFNSTLDLDSGYVSARYPCTLLYKGRGGGQEEAGIFHTAVKTINITGERLWIKAGVTPALGSRVCVGVVCLAQLLKGVALLQCPGVASSRRRVSPPAGISPPAGTGTHGAITAPAPAVLFCSSPCSIEVRQFNVLSSRASTLIQARAALCISFFSSKGLHAFGPRPKALTQRLKSGISPVILNLHPTPHPCLLLATDTHRVMASQAGRVRAATNQPGHLWRHQPGRFAALLPGATRYPLSARLGSRPAPVPAAWCTCQNTVSA